MSAEMGHHDSAAAYKITLNGNDCTPWWATLFEDPVFQGFWDRIIPPSHTAAEMAFVQKALSVAPPGRLLDALCGTGRHLLGLAALGYDVTGIDRATYPLRSIRERAARDGLKITLVQADVRDSHFEEEFDGACCLGASFGYYDDSDNEAFLRNIAVALKSGARFVLDAPIVAETALTRFTGRQWLPIGDQHLLIQYRYDSAESRLFEEMTIVQAGSQHRRTASYRIYLYREIVSMLQRAGFTAIVAYGGMDFRSYKLGDNECIIVACKD